MARRASVWTGNLAFGLVTIPVYLRGAEERHNPNFDLIDRRNNARIHYKRVNADTGEEVPWADIVKGYEYKSGKYVLLGDEDFKQAAVEQTHTIEILDFVDASDVSPLYFEKPYYVIPEQAGRKGYTLLREALERTERVGIAKVVMRTRQYLCAIYPEGKALVLDVLRFPDEVRGVAEMDLPEVSARALKVSPREIEMAEKLIETMSSAWEPQKYKDDYHEHLMSWIKRKVKEGNLEEADPAPVETDEEDAPAPINIMDLLKQSLDAHGKPRKGTSRRTRRRSAG